MGSMPCSSRTPVSFNVIPVLLPEQSAKLSSPPTRAQRPKLTGQPFQHQRTGSPSCLCALACCARPFAHLCLRSTQPCCAGDDFPSRDPACAACCRCETFARISNAAATRLGVRAFQMSVSAQCRRYQCVEWPDPMRSGGRVFSSGRFGLR